MKAYEKRALAIMNPDTAPRFSISSKQLPDVKEWEVGKDYTVEMTIKQVGKHIRDDGAVVGEFEIKEAEEES